MKHPEASWRDATWKSRLFASFIHMWSSSYSSCTLNMPTGRPGLTGRSASFQTADCHERSSESWITFEAFDKTHQSDLDMKWRWRKSWCVSVCRHAAALKTHRTFSTRLKMNVRVWRVDEPRRRLKRDKNIWNRSRRESRDKRIKQVTDHHHLHHPRFYLPMCYEFMDKGQVWTTAAHSQLVRNVRLRQPMELNPSVQINVWNQNQRL